eukprot:404562_1
MQHDQDFLVYRTDVLLEHIDLWSFKKYQNVKSLTFTVELAMVSLEDNKGNEIKYNPKEKSSIVHSETVDGSTSTPNVNSNSLEAKVNEIFEIKNQQQSCICQVDQLIFILIFVIIVVCLLI